MFRRTDTRWVEHRRWSDGKIIAAALQETAAGGATKAGAVFNEGDTLGPKIAGVKLLASPAETAKVIATLAKTDEMVVVGEERDGYVQVESGAGKGWVR